MSEVEAAVSWDTNFIAHVGQKIASNLYASVASRLRDNRYKTGIKDRLRVQNITQLRYLGPEDTVTEDHKELLKDAEFIDMEGKSFVVGNLIDGRLFTGVKDKKGEQVNIPNLALTDEVIKDLVNLLIMAVKGDHHTSAPNIQFAKEAFVKKVNKTGYGHVTYMVDIVTVPADLVHDRYYYFVIFLSEVDQSNMIKTSYNPKADIKEMANELYNIPGFAYDQQVNRLGYNLSKTPDKTKYDFLLTDEQIRMLYAMIHDIDISTGKRQENDSYKYSVYVQAEHGFTNRYTFYWNTSQFDVIKGSIQTNADPAVQASPDIQPSNNVV